MFNKLLIGLAAVFISIGAHGQSLNCKKLSTFPTTTIDGVPVAKCTASCSKVRPPACTDTDQVFPVRTPLAPVQTASQVAVSCTNITTFPTLRRKKPDGTFTDFPRCVSKCQAVRPPQCVDYNHEIH